MRPKLTFTPDQVRAARALLGWSAERLAARANLELEAVELFESGEAMLGSQDHERVGEALYNNGNGVIAICEDMGGPGVRFARPQRRYRMAMVFSPENSPLPTPSPRRTDADEGWLE